MSSPNPVFWFIQILPLIIYAAFVLREGDTRLFRVLFAGPAILYGLALAVGNIGDLFYPRTVRQFLVPLSFVVGGILLVWSGVRVGRPCAPSKILGPGQRIHWAAVLVAAFAGMAGLGYEDRRAPFMTPENTARLYARVTSSAPSSSLGDTYRGEYSYSFGGKDYTATDLFNRQLSIGSAIEIEISKQRPEYSRTVSFARPDPPLIILPVLGIMMFILAAKFYLTPVNSKL